MTDSVYYVNTGSIGGDGTGGIDVLIGATAAFSSLSSAESTLDGTIDSGDTVTIKCKGTDTTPDGYAFFNGWAISGSLIIESDESSRHNGIWNQNAYTMGNLTGDTILRIAEENVEVRFIQFDVLNINSQDSIYLSFGVDNIEICDNIFRSPGDHSISHFAFKLGHSGKSVNIRRNIIQGFRSVTSDTSGSGSLLTLDGNTIVNTQRISSSNKTNAPYLVNNVIYSSEDGITGNSDPLSNYNATDSVTFGTGYTTNTNDLINQTIDFVDLDNGDYRIVSTSPLKTAGSDGGQIGAYYEEGEPTGGELDLKPSVVKNLTSKVTLNKASSLYASLSLVENKTNNIALLALKKIDLSSSLAKNISNNIGLSRSSSLSVKGSIVGNYHQGIEIDGSSSISFSGSISKNYSQAIEQVKIARIKLNGSISNNLYNRINLDSSSYILLNSSVSKNLTGSVELKRISKLNLNTSKSKSLSFSIGFSSKLNLSFDGSASKNSSGSVRFIVGNVPDISPYDIKALSKTNKITAYSVTASISAKSKTTVYSCTITK